MEDEQMQMEVDWCLARVEEKLAGMDPYSRPAQEAAKVHRILKSSKAPVIKKRQAMRNMFGDYRAKMKAMEKKSLAAMKKSKLVAVAEPPTDSKFFRRAAGAQAAHEVSEKSVSSAADSLNQLSVNKTETRTDAQAVCPTECNPAGDSASSEGNFKFDFDSSECGPDAEAQASSGTGVHQNYFVIKPSNEEFRFNFTLDEHE
ncbi:uncharacterized protein LOC143287657 [Babylonia areolata]|uniref:uncharacterized protein LOC143287657 n=1 Tax=Babylonia areolata TaxID=304850 RepID=UPI003FD509CD